MSEAAGPQTKYKTINWSIYNAALKARGSLTIWLDREMHWFAVPSDKRGRCAHVARTAQSNSCR